jgi:hypothetical protein
MILGITGGRSTISLDHPVIVEMFVATASDWQSLAVAPAIGSLSDSGPPAIGDRWRLLKQSGPCPTAALCRSPMEIFEILAAEIQYMVLLQFLVPGIQKRIFSLCQQCLAAVVVHLVPSRRSAFVW